MANTGRFLLATTSIVLTLTLTAGAQPDGTRYRPGAAGAGDSYYPNDGNGGYNVSRYALDLRYRPATDRLAGTATITARATQDLSRFNLDLDRLHVRSVRVNGRPARWRHRGGELTVNPAGPGLKRNTRFSTVVRYGGVPQTTQSAIGEVGAFHTRDGVVIVGQPHAASTWFPANDHPTDAAALTVTVTVPRGLQAVANGALAGRERHGRTATWRWVADEKMATYLATLAIGRFRLDAYQRDGIRYWDAIDPSFPDTVARPRTGDRFALTGQDDATYKRLTRTIRVPADGGRLRFHTRYDLEPGFDFLFVEARPLRSTRWTTLRDRRGHTTRQVGFACAHLIDVHPFLRHYQRVKAHGACAPRGRTGTWHATTGRSDGWEQWSVGLGRYAGRRIQVSLTHVSDALFQHYGVFVDDVRGPGGQGTTSFEDDARPRDGWRTPGPPPRSPRNAGDWVLGTAADAPAATETVAARAFGKQPDIIAFLSRRFGRYPFATAGGILDNEPRIGFALETQTRPVYSRGFFFHQPDADTTVVHELAHHWYGNDLRLRRWRHLWLNEGPATYAEWLWLERTGVRSAERTFRLFYRVNPAGSPFWTTSMVDPKPAQLFGFHVYIRGAMVLHALRTRVGDEAFFRIMRQWAAQKSGQTVTSRQFIRHAERVSGRNLDRLFARWLYAHRRPPLSRR